MRNFRDKIAIVTGGASGIGRALSEALAHEGAEVVVTDINAEGASAVADGITGSGGRARAEALDVRDAEAFQALVRGVASRSGRIDYFFNNAGVNVNGEARDITLKDWREVLDVDLHGMVHGAAAVYPIMVSQGSGHIVNTCSVAGFLPGAMIAPYATAKHGIVGLSRSLRIEGADLGVKVSYACPGYVETPIIRKARAVRLDMDELRRVLDLKPMSAEECAQIMLTGVAQNRAIILVGTQAKVGWLLQCVAPWLIDRISIKQLRDMRKARMSEANASGATT
jgi:NAD(P)-dependent dehydrogenase (short-subunit alcohol dehydrogenase family)